MLLLARMATYGIYLTWDSVLLYVPTARSLLNGDGFTIWTGGPYANAAPLYPLILAFSSSLDLDVIQTAQYLHAALFGLTIFVIAMWLRTRIESRFLVVWAALSCVLSLSLIEFSARAGTEILFILFVCCSLFSMDRFLSTRKKSLLILSAFAAGGALLTRYVGVTLVGSGMLILLLRRNGSLRERLSNAGTYFFVAVSLFVVWMLRNILVIGSPLGRLPPDEFSLLRSLHLATDEISIWTYGITGLEFLDDQMRKLTGFSIDPASVSAIVLKSAILAYIIIGIGFALSRYRPGVYRRNREIFRCIFGFVSVYSIFYVIYLPVSDVMLPTRFLLPLFPVYLVMATIVLDGFVSKHQSVELSGFVRNRMWTKFVSIFASLVVALWTLSQITPNYDHIKSWNDHGRGYGSKSWGQSEIVEYLNTNPRDEVIWSNDHAALYHLLQNSDQKRIYRLPLDLAKASSIYSDNPSVSIENRIVWFYRTDWSGYSIRDLGASLGMEVEAILKDGFILQSGTSVDNPTDTYLYWGDDFLLDALLNDVHLIIDSNFDVYIDNRHNRLIYVRHSCGVVDIIDPVILQIFPTRNSNLPIHRQQYGFDEFRFYLTDHFIPINNNYCIAIRSLPIYDISAIRTGKIQGDSVTLEGEYTFIQ